MKSSPLENSRTFAYFIISILPNIEEIVLKYGPKKIKSKFSKYELEFALKELTN